MGWKRRAVALKCNNHPVWGCLGGAEAIVADESRGGRPRTRFRSRAQIRRDYLGAECVDARRPA